MFSLGFILRRTSTGETFAETDATNYGKTQSQEPIKPLSQTLALDPRKVALGQELFHEPMLSRDNTVSCASCHSLEAGGTDHRSHSLGIGNAEGTVNAPTVFNSGYNFRQFWDGRASSLEEQVDGPLQNTVEMASSWAEVIRKLRNTPKYANELNQIYKDGVQPKNVRDAIAEFERSLTTPNSPIDRYLRGDRNALTAREQEGYHKFKIYGCASCHQGMNIGGNMFETLGAMADYFGDRGHLSKADLGRFNITGKEEDKFVFKVPSLRNVAQTAPYFHDGSVGTIKEAVQLMAKYQLGRALPDADVDDIVQFLKTLTGEYGGKRL